MTIHRCAATLFAVLLSGLANAQSTPTTTPIKHLVVILDENQSFDHYFGTYPVAMNPQGEPQFTALPGTPQVNGLTGALIAHNPNSAPPFRLDRTMDVTCDNDNHYTDEQKAYDAGLLDKFVQITSNNATGCTPNLGMGYYDGNTVTALWNYAQHYSMGDNFFDTEFGTTVMGHLNLISGSTHQTNTTSISGKIANGSIIGNVEAGYDDCATGTLVKMTGKNIGDLLNTGNVSWGWFYGDWLPTRISNGVVSCSSVYNSHYDPFNYYASTANQHHMPPELVADIGQTDQANHQYSIGDFWDAAYNGYLPSVSFLKATANSTGHPQNSNPLAEQTFLVDTINDLMQLPEWSQMAIVITYDDSDGWYDHVMPPIVSQSNDSANDALNGSALCGTPQPGAYLDRCGYGSRLPFMVISPFAKPNYVDHSLMDLTSVTRFIEDNWLGGARIGDQSFDAIAGTIENSFNFTNLANPNPPLILDPTAGTVVDPSSGPSTNPTRGRNATPRRAGSER